MPPPAWLFIYVGSGESTLMQSRHCFEQPCPQTLQRHLLITHPQFVIPQNVVMGIWVSTIRLEVEAQTALEMKGRQNDSMEMSPPERQCSEGKT